MRRSKKSTTNQYTFPILFTNSIVVSSHISLVLKKKHYTPPRKRITYTSKWCNPHFCSLMMILNKKSTFGNLIEATHISQVMLFFCSQKPSSWRWMPGFLANQKTFGPEALHRKRRVPDLWPYAKLIKHHMEMVSLKYK